MADEIEGGGQFGIHLEGRTDDLVLVRERMAALSFLVWVDEWMVVVPLKGIR